MVIGNDKSYKTSLFHTLVTIKKRKSVFAQELFRHSKGNICDYLKKMKVSYTVAFFQYRFSFIGIGD